VAGTPGKRPSKKLDSNPFFEMLDAAWQDWKGEKATIKGVSFISQHQSYSRRVR
jgi:hypothetical protein